MNKEKLWPRVFCHAQKRNVNPDTAFVYPSNHFTTMWVEIPWEIAFSGNEFDGMQWVGEEFNWTFMPIKFCVCKDENEIKEILNEYVENE